MPSGGAWVVQVAPFGMPWVSQRGKQEIGKLDEDYNRHITYYASETPEAIAAAVEGVIAHYDNKVQLALELQKKVLSEYTIEGTGKIIDGFLSELVNKFE